MMKSFAFVCACATAFAIVPSVRAELQVYESFEQSKPGPLLAQTSGEGFSGRYSDTGVGTVVRDATTRMIYKNGELAVDGGTTWMRMQPTEVKDKVVWGRSINPLTPPEGDGPFYMSFLFRVSDSVAQGEDEDALLFGLTTTPTSNPLYGLSLLKHESGTGNTLAMRAYNKDVKTGCPAVEGDKTYLLVFKWYKTPKYKYYRGFDMIVNPTTSAEPEQEEWTVVDSNLDKPLDQYLALSCYFRKSCELEDFFEIDEFRFGTSWADVTGPATYNGTVPRPTISVGSGDGVRVVTIIPAIDGCTCYYTTDESTPTAETGTLYTAPFSLTASAIVKAVAVDAQGRTSPAECVGANFESHWVGAGEDEGWLTPENWLPQGSPANNAIVFGEPDRTKEGEVNNRILGDITVQSLTYTNNNYFQTTTDNRYWHVTEIASDATLTVSGQNENGRALELRVEEPTTSKNKYVAAKFTGGGRLKIVSPESDVLGQHNSNNDVANVRLDMGGLSAFECAVSKFVYCLGKRTQGVLTLPATGVGETLLTCDAFYLGDCHGQDQGGGTVEMKLGKSNAFNADIFYIGAPEEGFLHCNGGKVSFASGLTEPTFRLRAKDGVGRADFVIGSHGVGVAATPRGMTVTADLSGGSVDILAGDFVLGNGLGYQWSSSYGQCEASFAMADGTADVLSATIAHSAWTSGSRNVQARPVKGDLLLSGGRFTVQNDVRLAYDDVEAYQSVVGTIGISGGTMDVGGEIVLATRLSLATNVIATVSVSGGELNVGGGLRSGEAIDDLQDPANVVGLQANVNALGGVIAVTNAEGSAELRLEKGTLALAGGKVYADALVLTNEASTVAVTLGADAFPTAEVGALKLGGALRAELADGVTAKAGTVWHVVSGTAAREGQFGSVELPEGFKVRYTATGFDIEKKGAGMVLLVR